MLDDKDLLNLQLTLIIVLLVTSHILILVLPIISSRSTKIVKKNENEMINDTNEAQDVTCTISSTFADSRDQAFEIPRNEKFSAASKSQDEVKSDFADTPTYDRTTSPKSDCGNSQNDSTCDENEAAVRPDVDESSDQVTENSILTPTMLPANNFNKPGTLQPRPQQDDENRSFTDNTTAPAKEQQDQICDIPKTYETAKNLHAIYNTHWKNLLLIEWIIRPPDIHVFTVNPDRYIRLCGRCQIEPAEEFVLGSYIWACESCADILQQQAPRDRRAF